MPKKSSAGSSRANNGSNSEAIRIAMEAKTKAYAPYSKFSVGSALVGKNGKIYAGCNVENIVYQGNCAERAALTVAVVDGCREFEEIYIATDAKTPTPPCGYCRQFLAEFLEPSARINLVQKGKVVEQHTLQELLPLAFGPKNLK